MNTRDGNIEGFIDHLIIGKRENTIKNLDNNVPIENVIDTITIEDLVDDVITIKGENTIKTFNDTRSIHDRILYSGDLMVITGYSLLHATGMFPLSTTLRPMRVLQRVRMVTLSYLVGGLSLLTMGKSIIFLRKINQYLFSNIIK